MISEEFCGEEGRGKGRREKRKKKGEEGRGRGKVGRGTGGWNDLTPHEVVVEVMHTQIYRDFEHCTARCKPASSKMMLSK